MNMYNSSLRNDWKPNRQRHSQSHNSNSTSNSSMSSSSTTNTATPNGSGTYSNGNSFQSSSSLSRGQGTYTKRFEASGRKSPVISGQSSTNRKSSRSRSDSSEGRMHPAARALNKRASSAERMYPVRSIQQLTQSGDSVSTTGTRSGYNRSTSMDRYTGGTDYRRLSSSVDYSTQLSSMDLGKERLDSGGGEDMSSRNDYHNSVMQASREKSASSSNIYQNGMSSTGRDRLYSAEEVDKIRAQYNQEIQEIKLDYQSRILAKDREWDKRLQASKSELSNSQKLVMELRQRCNDMAAEYDKSMTELLNDKESATQVESNDGEVSPEIITSLRAERDQYADDLHQVEKSFTELHKRYDKLREALQSQRRNDERLKEELADAKQQIRTSSKSFDKLRTESQEKLSKAAGEVEKAKTSCKAEIMRLQMALKKSEVHSQSVNQQLQQKINENAELAQICDNLIALKGGNMEPDVAEQ